MKLNESVFELLGIPTNNVFEIPTDGFSPVPLQQPPLTGPEEGNSCGVADLLLQAMKNEIELIQFYNSAIVTVSDTEFDDIQNTLTTIVNNHNLHLGMLEEVLNIVSPNAQNIISGVGEVVTDEIASSSDSITETLRTPEGTVWKLRYHDYTNDGKLVESVEFTTDKSRYDIIKELSKHIDTGDILSLVPINTKHKVKNNQRLKESADTKVNEWNFKSNESVNKKITIEKRLVDSINDFCKSAGAISKDTDIDVTNLLEEDANSFRQDFTEYVKQNDYLEESTLKECFNKIDELFEEYISIVDKDRSQAEDKKKLDEYRTEFNEWYSEGIDNSVMNKEFSFDKEFLAKNKELKQWELD